MIGNYTLALLLKSAAIDNDTDFRLFLFDDRQSLPDCVLCKMKDTGGRTNDKIDKSVRCLIAEQQQNLAVINNRNSKWSSVQLSAIDTTQQTD